MATETKWQRAGFNSEKEYEDYLATLQSSLNNILEVQQKYLFLSFSTHS
jgi:hypothetical protein